MGVIGAGRSPDWAGALLGGQLSEPALRELLRACRLVHARAGQTLLQPDDDRAVLILRGTAKAHTVSSHGDEVITDLLSAGGCSGLLVALGYASHGTQLTALEPVDALVVSGPRLRTLVPAHPEITTACLETIAHQHAAASEDRRRFAGTSVPQRVSLRLLDLAERWGTTDGAEVTVSLPLTQEELAAWCGTSRESVSKVLHGLRDAGIIATRRRGLRILDLDRLRERCDRERESVEELASTLAKLA